MHKFDRFLFAILISLSSIFIEIPRSLALEGLKNPELQDIRNSVLFIFADNSNPCSLSSKVLPLGTGFVIGLRPTANPESIHKFVITNRHVLANRTRVILRFNNTLNNASICHRADLTTAMMTPKDKSIDLAAISIPDINGTSPTVLDYSYVLGVKELKQAEIVEGTEVVAMGYLQPYAGFTKNFPVMRFGKIALLTHERWWSADGSSREQGYIVEIYNVGGSSGSPVVLQPSQVRVNSNNQFQKRRIPPYLIGVIKGHPNSIAEIAEADQLGVKKSNQQIRHRIRWSSCP